ncbi:MAG: DMT family transporter, partial [Granulosicoccaceae bacterium]
MPHSRRAPDATAYATMIVLCVIWGSQQVVIKLMAPYMAPVAQIAFRSLIVCTLLGAYLVFARNSGGLPRSTWLPGCGVGVLFATEFICIAEGLRLTSASHMVVFLYTAPLFTTIGLHFLVAQERMSRLQWAGLVTAIIGIAVAFLGPGSASDGSSLLGDLVALMAGAAWGVTTVVIRHSSLNTLSA